MTRARLAKAVGLALGIALVAMSLNTWQVRSTGTALGADLQVVAVPPGELMLAPAGAFLKAHGLHTGRVAAGRLSMRNIAPRPLRVHVRALPSGHDLDAALHAEIVSGGRRVASGTLGDLRAWSARTLALGVGEEAEVHMRAWLGRGERERYRGAITNVTLELRAVVEEA